MKAHAEWTVLAHDPIQELSPNVWRVEGSLPNMPLRRVMTLVRLPDNDLIIHSAIAVNDATLEKIERWGKPRWLLVPNGWHRLDAPAFRTRYPGVKLLCPSGSRKRVAQVVAVDGTYEDFPGSDAARLETLSGVKKREGVLIARDEDGTTLVFNDVIFNQPHLPGLFGRVYKALGQSGAPKITFISKRFLIADKRALADHLRRLAEEPDLRRIIVAHLDVIEDGPADVLRKLAAGLSRS